MPIGSTQSVPVLTGTPPTFAVPSASDTAEIGTILIVKNGSASSINVTLVTPGTLPTGDAYPDKVIAVPAGGERWIPVLPDYQNPGGIATVNFSATSGISAAAINRV
jgi:hypothetical protein